MLRSLQHVFKCPSWAQRACCLAKPLHLGQWGPGALGIVVLPGIMNIPIRVWKQPLMQTSSILVCVCRGACQSYSRSTVPAIQDGSLPLRPRPPPPFPHSAPVSPRAEPDLGRYASPCENGP